MNKFRVILIWGPILLVLLIAGWASISSIEAGMNRIVYGAQTPIDRWIYLKGSPLLPHRWPRYESVEIVGLDLSACLWILYWIPPDYNGPIFHAGEWIDESMNLACSCNDGNSWKIASEMPEELHAWRMQYVVGKNMAYRSDEMQLFSRSSASAQWRTINPELDGISISLPNRMTLLAVDPQDEMKLYMVWEGLGSDPSAAWEKTDPGLHQPGLCVSKDGGKHFTKLVQFYWKMPRDFNFKTLAVDPHNPDHLLAQYAEGLISSNDQGKSWMTVKDYDRIAASAAPWFSTERLNTRITSITFDRYRRGHVFAASNKGLLFSADNGHQWKIANMGFSSFDPNITIAAHPKKDLIFIASKHGLFKTADGGVSWEEVNTPDTSSFWRRVIPVPYLK
jgi:hypothetical protein